MLPPVPWEAVHRHGTAWINLSKGLDSRLVLGQNRTTTEKHGVINKLIVMMHCPMF
jgi:hypothetical protein